MKFGKQKGRSEDTNEDESPSVKEKSGKKDDGKLSKKERKVSKKEDKISDSGKKKEIPGVLYSYPTKSELVDWEKDENGMVILTYRKNLGRFEEWLQKKIGGPLDIKRPLDAPGSRIWLLSDGKHNIMEICKLIEEEFKEEMDPVFSKVRRFYEQLLILNLIILKSPEEMKEEQEEGRENDGEGRDEDEDNGTDEGGDDGEDSGEDEGVCDEVSKGEYNGEDEEGEKKDEDEAEMEGGNQGDDDENIGEGKENKGGNEKENE